MAYAQGSVILAPATFKRSPSVWRRSTTQPWLWSQTVYTNWPECC